jgi:hypothetical protein
MDRTPAVLVASQKVKRPRPLPRLKLLIERESGYRVFLRNLADLFWTPEPAPLLITSLPGRFWNDVFVPTALPWWSFAESMVWHVLLVVLFVWAQSRVWQPVKTFSGKEALRGSITYYPPSESFRASESHVAKPNPRSRMKQATRKAEAMRVAPEQKTALVTPPDIRQATAGLPNLVNTDRVPPMMPLAATGEARRGSLVATSGVVAPPAQISQAATRKAALAQAGAVAPAPEFGAVSATRRMKSANAGGLPVVPPPPSVQDAGNSTRAANTLAGAGQNIVPPPPPLQSGSNGSVAGRMATMAGSGTNVVPPPPSVHGAGNGAGEGRLGLLSATGSQVVPPPPSMQAAGSSTRSGRTGATVGSGPNVVPPPPSLGAGGGAKEARLGSPGGVESQVVPPPPPAQSATSLGQGRRAGALAGSGPNVIPPPPALQGMGNGEGRAVATGGSSQVVPPPPSVRSASGSPSRTRLGSLAGTGAEVVPPPPGVENAANAGAGGRAGIAAGDGSQIVPPPPSLEGSGGGSGGRAGSLAGGDSNVIAPAQTGGSGNPAMSSTGKTLEPMPPDDSVAGTESKSEDKSTIEELPLGLLGLVFTAQGSSYFSNFEVFVAKRKMGKDQLQLIKLVYEFLPYQKRLSEYDLNSLPARVIKLRVTPDPSCNESLGDIVQPPADQNRPAADYPKLPAALLSADLNAVLPCYRTTAEEFRKAMSHGR